LKSQIDYIDANPAAPRSEAKQRQTAARAAAVAKRKALGAQLKSLVAAQREVVAEARLDNKAVKKLRSERQKMVRSAGRLQEAIGEDSALYRVSTTAGKGTTHDWRLEERAQHRDGRDVRCAAC
jgi:hypothetical protein